MIVTQGVVSPGTPFAVPAGKERSDGDTISLLDPCNLTPHLNDLPSYLVAEDNGVEVSLPLKNAGQIRGADPRCVTLMRAWRGPKGAIGTSS